MCLGIPAKVLSTGEPGNPLSMGAIDMRGEQRPCSFAYLPEAEVGDWVLIQNSFAMSTMSDEDAQEALAAIEELDLITQVAHDEGRIKPPGDSSASSTTGTGAPKDQSGAR